METVNGIKPLYFAAPLNWYADVIDCSELVVVNERVFDDRSYRNRLQFTGISGLQNFSIPLRKDSRKGTYRQVEISYQEHWQNRLVNALRTSYGKSPFFEYYDYQFEPLLKQAYTYLWDLNLDLLKTTLRCLKLDVNIKIQDGELISDQEDPGVNSHPYYQVFADKNGFIPGLSILDLIYNEGPAAYGILLEMKNKNQIIK